jgi:hypothetical protein
VSTQQTYPELHHGANDGWVTYLQEQLTALGYQPGPADGEFGPNTEAEVRRLQSYGGLPTTGVVDGATWALLEGREPEPATGAPYGGGASESPNGGDPTAAPAPTATAVDFVQLCLSQEGDDYDYGVDVDLDDPDPASFDCAELVEWALSRLGVLDGLKGDWNWSQGQRAAVEAAGLGCTVDDARNVPGALLFNAHHVAVSLGDGVQTIEAMGEDFNVRKGKIDGTSGRPRFDGAGRVPNLRY